MKELILGGMRSGKSRLAEITAQQSGLEVVYIATASADDTEMQLRIEHHRQQRPDHWLVIEEPLALASMLEQQAREGRCLLVDCLTLWLTNLLCLDDENRLQAERDALIKIVAHLPGHIIFVSNETGMGVVPMGELTRRYCDEAGRLHQSLAENCDRVTLTVAGLSLVLKGKTE